jgi:hypothetical protein
MAGAKPQAVDRNFEAAETTLRDARLAFKRRRTRDAVLLAHQACRLAAQGLEAALGGDVLGTSRQPGDAPDSPAAFFHRLEQFKKRLDSDAVGQVHVEEAANYLRQTRNFIDRMRDLT